MTVAPPETVYDMARRLTAAGVCVLPIRVDKPKAPALPTWEEYETRRPTENELAIWFRGKRRGIAAIGGAVSGGLECIDFDEPGLFERWADDVDLANAELLGQLVIVHTPKGGAHAWFRSDHCEPNQVLAWRPSTADELREKPRTVKRKRIETRGAGGYALLPGSPPECHETNKLYAYASIGLGALERVQSIAIDDRETLLSLARAHHTYAEPDKAWQAPPRPQGNGDGLTPGNDFDRRGTWQEVLDPHGWKLADGTWEDGRLTRPGKSNGVSATIGKCKSPAGDPLLHVFSTDAGIEAGTYGRFRAFAAMNHRGDWKAAATALSQRGFGDRRPPVPSANGRHQVNGHHQANSQEPLELITRSLAGRKARPVNWLVDGKIPLGKLSCLAGVGGMGKSTLTRHLIAALTTGRPAFGLHYDAGEPCEVLLASVEDSPEDTIIPHLIAEGADLSRVHMVEGVRKGTNDRLTPFDLRDLELMESVLKINPRIRILVIDPIMSFIGRAGVNENASAEVRTLLDPLIEIADRYGIAIVLIAHLNKATNAAAVNRIVGSTAFRDGCRAVYAVGHDPNDPDRRVMALVKENVPGLDRRSVSFARSSVEGDDLARVLAAPEFADLSPIDRERMGSQLAVLVNFQAGHLDADAALGTPGKDAANSGGPVRQCASWLLERLGTTYAWCDEEIETEAVEKGYSVSAYRRAKSALKPRLQVAPPAYGKPWIVGIGPIRQMVLRQKDVPEAQSAQKEPQSAHSVRNQENAKTPEKHQSAQSDQSAQRNRDEGPDLWPP